MCVYSLIIDHYSDKWQDRYTLIPTQTQPWRSAPLPGAINLWQQPWITTAPDDATPWPTAPVNPLPPPQLTREEIEDLRKLLERAKKYDAETNQKDCELERKKEALLRLGELLGVKLSLP